MWLSSSSGVTWRFSTTSSRCPTKGIYVARRLKASGLFLFLAPWSEGNAVRVGGCGSSWFKSSYSGTSSNCVEVSDLDDATAMRDSMNRDLGMLNVSAGEWDAFVGVVRRSG
ncbi:DUF397 domain-containing protein [Nocardiopsis sp. NPDC006198]|uniref:DUF397 domain-containing protein n=1 Tax=Nocardiopsis sp. NPDC006198 TaxID=3154472 RepID=UPI0033ACD33E